MDGDFVRKKIELAKFQLVEVAEKMNITPQDLHSKLKAKDVKVSFLQKIAEAINKNVYYFFENENSTKSLKNVLKKNEDIFEDINEDKPNVKKILTMKSEHSPLVREENENYFVPKGIPLIPIDAMAGFGTGSMQVMAYDTGSYIVPEFSELNVDFMIRVKGSSMYPKYNSGDLVACKKLYISDVFFQWNKVYVLDTEQGALIKRVKKGTKDQCVKLVSDNENYDPFELHLSKIYAVALVVGVIRLE